MISGTPGSKPLYSSAASDVYRRQNLGAFVREHLVGLGYASRMFVTIMRRSAFLLKRPRLVTDQVHFVGNYSFVIIAVSGLFVGFVLGFEVHLPPGWHTHVLKICLFPAYSVLPFTTPALRVWLT